MDINRWASFDSRNYSAEFARALLPLLALCLFAPLATAQDDTAGARDLGVDERVAYQQRTDEIYRQYRTTSGDAARTASSIDALPTAEAIRAKVKNDLLKEEILARYWDVSISPEKIQAEMNRIALATRMPDRLREIFAALDNDPAIIAECLVRPSLVDGALRERYASDDRFHGRLKAEIERELERYPDVSQMSLLGPDYTETVWRKLEENKPAVADPRDPRIVYLDSEEWDRAIVSLARQFGLPREHRVDYGELPLRALSPLREKTDRFVVAAVLERGVDELRVATLSWPKTGFDTWWNDGATAPEEQDDAHLSGSAASPVFTGGPGEYQLPAVAASGCTDDTWTPIDPGIAPTARYDHTAVWTGAEMIVWGGQDLDMSIFDTGARYDPATDRWTTMSTSGAPAARYNHSAVWTGTEMIVWGGQDFSYLQTGGRYNPATDSWAPTSTGSGVPSERLSPTTVWTGTEMIVWGGYGGGSYLQTGGRYDPVTDSWLPTSTTGAVPVGRQFHTAVWAETGMIVWGGIYWEVSDYVFVLTGSVYRPSTDTWEPMSTVNVPVGRHGHTAVWSEDGGRMIVWGGYDGVGYPETGGLYDPSRNEWEPTDTGTEMPEPRYQHSAVWDGAYKMIVWGGRNDSAHLNTGGRYDSDEGTWHSMSTIGAPSPRSNHAAVWADEANRMIVWGGWNLDLYEDLDTGSRYDPADDVWYSTTQGPPAPWNRNGHTATWTGSEMIVWGGNENWITQQTGARYDPATDIWTPTSVIGAPSARHGHSAVWIGNELIVWGGVVGGAYDNTGGRYDPATDSWNPTSIGLSVPPGRYGHTAIWTGAPINRMVVWGGYGDGYTVTDTGGRYDPFTDAWQPTSMDGAVPTPRYEHTAVWTGAPINRMIVWGGYKGIWGGGNEYPELRPGGRYDPVSDTWSATTTAGDCPTSRYGHTAVWTGPPANRMIVWGGLDPYFVRGQVGARYDPVTDTWAATSLVAAPQGRSEHTATWTGGEMIVWGGQTPSLDTGGRYNPVDDAWSATAGGAGCPAARQTHTAVWTAGATDTEAEMIVWAGQPASTTGGRYCAEILRTWYADGDGDGWGLWGISVQTALRPDGYAALAGDCDDSDPDVYPGAPEMNDGKDNQCDGDLGYGSVDELSGFLEFSHPLDKNELAWPGQTGATMYQVARADDPQFLVGAVCLTTSTAAWSDIELPPEFGVFYYLARPFAPYLGSWGRTSAEVERTVVCP